MLNKYHLAIVCLSLFSLSNCRQLNKPDYPLKNNLEKHKVSTNLTKFLNQKSWNQLFPTRYGIGMRDSINHDPDFYSFKSFVAAANVFPYFYLKEVSKHRKQN